MGHHTGYWLPIAIPKMGEKISKSAWKAAHHPPTNQLRDAGEASPPRDTAVVDSLFRRVGKHRTRMVCLYAPMKYNALEGTTPNHSRAGSPYDVIRLPILDVKTPKEPARAANMMLSN